VKRLAKAIGVGDKIGSLEADTQADLILADVRALVQSPLLNTVPNLAYTAERQDGGD
jgi:imidazolonepropionase-like amidohydrolase